VSGQDQEFLGESFDLVVRGRRQPLAQRRTRGSSSVEARSRTSQPFCPRSTARVQAADIAQEDRKSKCRPANSFSPFDELGRCCLHMREFRPRIQCTD
jgi:hypothetical protein